MRGGERERGRERERGEGVYLVNNGIVAALDEGD